eukprot:gene2972-4982_t
MNNRLEELESIVPEIEIRKDKVAEIDVDVLDPDVDSHLTEFNKKVESIEADMDIVKGKIHQIQSLHKKAITSTVSSERNELKEELNKIITSTGQATKKIQDSLEKLKEDTEKRKKEVENKNTAEIRMREGQHLQLMKRFGALITDYQEMQAEYQKHYKDRMKRTVKITNPDLTEDEVDELMANNQIDEDAYKKKILTKSQQGTINAYYDEAVETRKDILMLEASLIELQDMFVTMAQLVAQQDDLIDNIENNVISADEYVKKAVEDVKKAQGNQEKSKWALYGIIIAVVVFVIVVIIAIIVLGGGSIAAVFGGLAGTGTI